MSSIQSGATCCPKFCPREGSQILEEGPKASQRIPQKRKTLKPHIFHITKEKILDNVPINFLKPLCAWKEKKGRQSGN